MSVFEDWDIPSAEDFQHLVDEMRVIRLNEEDILSDEEVEQLAGVKLDHRHYDEDKLFGRVNGDDTPVRIEKPNGEPLAVYIPDAIPREVSHEAYRGLRELAIDGGAQKGNRAMATGKDSRRLITKEDGSVSDTPGVPREMSPNTGIAGYFDRYTRTPYCRQTAFNINQPEKFAQATPMFQYANSAMAAFVPDRYANQKKRADETVDDWLIEDTAFTTVTVNLNWQTAAHTDSGDLPEGFGVMTVTSLGDYDGAYYIQPQYKTAFDIRSGDIILSDVHEWHGNGPFTDTRGYYERLSCVLYYRKQMLECGTAEEETEHAKKARDLEATGEAGAHEQSLPEPTQRTYETEDEQA